MMTKQRFYRGILLMFDLCLLAKMDDGCRHVNQHEPTHAIIVKSSGNTMLPDSIVTIAQIDSSKRYFNYIRMRVR